MPTKDYKFIGRGVKRYYLTPQEKKLPGYIKDTRYTYGESLNNSRFAFAKSKSYHHQSLCHEQKLILKPAAKVISEQLESIESKVRSVEPKRWRKCADSSLSELISD